MRYEDLLNDAVATFTRAARFLDVPHDSARLQKAIQFSGFEELSRQESQGWFRERPGRAKEPFFRCGRAGGWRETLTDAQVAQIIDDHGPVMGRFGYLDGNGHPV